MIHNTKCTMKEVLLSIKEKYLQEGERAVEKDEDSVKLVIMPPTGSNNHIAYILTGIGSLLIVVAGIILIKKKIWR